jgi:hypothetical protein
MNDQDLTVSDLSGDAGHAQMAAWFIAEAERMAALGLPAMPDDPAAAAAMRMAGYDVLAECTSIAGGAAVVSVASEDEELGQRISGGDLAVALGVPVALLPGMRFLAVLRETPEAGRVLSRFRRVPGRE